MFVKIKPMLTNIEEEDVEHPFASIQPTEIIVLRDRLTLHKIPKSINKVEEGKAIANYEYFAHIAAGLSKEENVYRISDEEYTRLEKMFLF